MSLSSDIFRNRVLLPIALVLGAAWFLSGVLARKEAALAREATLMRADLRVGGFETDVTKVEERFAVVQGDIERLRAYAEAGIMLAADPLIKDHETEPFQLIEFERERSAANQAALEAAKQAGVKLDASAFGVLEDSTESSPQPRRRWAQLAVARETARRAIAAKVSTYEALPVPAVREIRVEEGGPVLADEILFSVRVTGESARVQDFLESIALGFEKNDARFFIEHLVLRKDGIQAPDLASATIVLSALLPPSDIPAP